MDLELLRNEPAPSNQDGFLSQLHEHIQMSAETCACLFSASGAAELTFGLSGKTSVACRDNDTSKKNVLKIMLLIQVLVLLPRKTFGHIWSQFW